jgi:hypothetical protein
MIKSKKTIKMKIGRAHGSGLILNQNRKLMLNRQAHEQDN